MDKIKCNTITYRQGYIEIVPAIHDLCINLETWEISSEIDLQLTDINNDDFPESGVIGNTEIELSIENAKTLVKQLQQVIDTLEKTKLNS